jgi:hypothetical protein
MNKRIIKVASLLSVGILISGCTMLKAISIVNSGEAISSHPIESTIPFDMKAHAIIIKARVNDSTKEFNFILDTAALTVVDQKTASELGLNGEVEVELNDSAGKTKKVKLAKLGILSIGDVKVKDSAAVIADLSDIGCDGIVGSSFLRYFRVTIDYRHRLLTFSDSKKSVPANDGEVVIKFKPEMTQGFAPKIECTVDKSIDTDAFIDTGHPGIGLPTEIMRKLKEFKEGEVLESEGSMSSGLAGSSDKDYLLRMDSLSLGKLEFNNVPCASSGTHEVLIGQKALSHFLVTLDYPAGEMILKRYENDKYETNVFSWGLALKRDKGRVVVKGLMKGSPAARSGIKVGDEVFTVNSMDVSQLSMLDLMALSLDDGIDRVEFVYSGNGGKKMVVLKKEMLLPLVK